MKRLILLLLTLIVVSCKTHDDRIESTGTIITIQGNDYEVRFHNVDYNGDWIASKTNSLGSMRSVWFYTGRPDTIKMYSIVRLK